MLWDVGLGARPTDSTQPDGRSLAPGPRAWSPLPASRAGGEEETKSRAPAPVGKRGCGIQKVLLRAPGGRDVVRSSMGAVVAGASPL